MRDFIWVKNEPKISGEIFKQALLSLFFKPKITKNDLENGHF